MGFSTYIPGSRQVLSKSMCQTKQTPTSTPQFRELRCGNFRGVSWGEESLGCGKGGLCEGLGWERDKPCPWPTLAPARNPVPWADARRKSRGGVASPGCSGSWSWESDQPVIAVGPDLGRGVRKGCIAGT